VTRFWIGAADKEGRVLALVHGAGGNHTLWAEVYRGLRDRGVPVLAPDLPGHGGNRAPARRTIDACAEAVAQFLSEIGVVEYAVAGHSLGGAAALALAARAPEGLRGAGAISTGAKLPVDPRILEGTLKNFEYTVDNLARYLFAKGTDRQKLAEAAAMMAAAGPETLHSDFAACSAYRLSAEQLGAIDIPVEVVCGEVDVLTPMALSEELVEKIPGSRLTRLPASGHMPMLENPVGLTEVLARLWERSFGGDRKR
jgi:pimeloyl-ACP methyl ester carboxylesterase